MIAFINNVLLYVEQDNIKSHMLQETRKPVTIICFHIITWPNQKPPLITQFRCPRDASTPFRCRSMQTG
jgi:hypothetical protein